MKLHKAVAILLVFPSALALQAKNKKSPGVPAVFGQARYVYVEAVDGQVFDPNLLPEDRAAISDVRDALEDWNRYTLTMRRDQADLVIVVRKARAVSGNVGITPHHGQLPNGTGQPSPNGPAGAGAQWGADAGPAEDFFEVCSLDPGGNLSSPLWERSMQSGLDTPDMLLVEQFRKAVDKAYPSQPAPKTQKP